jgi:hypothetical protein
MVEVLVVLLALLGVLHRAAADASLYTQDPPILRGRRNRNDI